MGGYVGGDGQFFPDINSKTYKGENRYDNM